MKAAQKQYGWTEYIKFFNKQNAGRPTRLGVFEGNGKVDYWLECGLPLAGVDVDAGKGQTAVQITVGDFTHEIKDAFKLMFQFGLNGQEDGIDIADKDGRTTILRFESEAKST